jgi:hypothetical protein
MVPAPWSFGHHPITPSMEKLIVLAPRASKGRQQWEPHTTGGPPFFKQQWQYPLYEVVFPALSYFSSL